MLGIMHLSKAGKDPLERLSGSLAFGALPRLVLFAAKNNSGALDEAEHIMVRVKSNIGPSGGGFGYHFDVADVMLGVDPTRLVWEAAIEWTARELLGNAEGHPDDRVSKLDQAKAFLNKYSPMGSGFRPKF